MILHSSTILQAHVQSNTQLLTHRADLLIRLATECSSWSDPRLQNVIAGDGAQRSQRQRIPPSRYRRRVDESPDKAQLMMLADAADISGIILCSPPISTRPPAPTHGRSLSMIAGLCAANIMMVWIWGSNFLQTWPCSLQSARTCHD